MTSLLPRSGAALLVFAAVAAAQNPYTIKRIAQLPGHFGSDATSIDDAGRVSGTSGTVTGYAWDGDPAQPLPDHVGGFASRSCGIGAGGQWLGAARTSSGWDHATIWTPGVGGFTLTALAPAAGDLFSIAEDMNLAGDVCGCTDDGIDYKPAVWEPNAGGYTVTPLPLVPGDFGGVAFAMDAASTIVGFSGSPAGTHAMRWTKTGGTWGFTVLAGFGGSTQAEDINALGEVAGSAFSPFGWRMAGWDPSGTFVDLGQYQNVNTSAHAINSHGHTVGQAQGVGSSGIAVGRFGGFATDAPVQDLNSMLPPLTPWTLTSATGINDRGEIVGRGDVGGFIHSFVMQPITLDLGVSPGVAGVVNTWTITGATPGQPVALLVDLAGGDVAIPGCRVSLDLAGVHVLVFLLADNTGTATLSAFFPPALAGIPFLFQAFQPQNCLISDVPLVVF